MNIKIIGGGPGDERFLTKEAREAIATADLVISNKRFSNWLKPLCREFLLADLSETIAKLEGQLSEDKVIAVVVSGDVGFYSFSKKITEKFPLLKLEYINGLNSMQYLLAKLRCDYNGLKTVSLHGRDKNIIPLVCYNERLFVLTGGSNSVSSIVTQLAQAGFTNLRLAIGENLGQAGERITQGIPEELLSREFAGLSVIYIENEKHIKPWSKISDHEFERGKVPMTKAEVRDICLAKLALEPDNVAYDIGAGTGSVSVTMARLLYKGRVYAVEKNDEAFDLALRNIKKFRAYNAQLIRGEAPEALANLPPPDKVFIGGSSGNLDSILTTCLAKNSMADILITAISLETLAESIDLLKKLGRQFTVTTVNIASSSAVGAYTLMKANNPIFIIQALAKGTYENEK